MAERTITIKRIDPDPKTGEVRVRFLGGHTTIFASRMEFDEWADRDTRSPDEDQRQACRKAKADDPTLVSIVDKEYTIIDTSVSVKAVPLG